MGHLSRHTAQTETNEHFPCTAEFEGFLQRGPIRFRPRCDFLKYAITACFLQLINLTNKILSGG